MKYVFRKDPFYAKGAREKEMSDDLMFSKHEETTFDICEFCPECGRPLTDKAWDEMENG